MRQALAGPRRIRALQGCGCAMHGAVRDAPARVFPSGPDFPEQWINLPGASRYAWQCAAIGPCGLRGGNDGRCCSSAQEHAHENPKCQVSCSRFCFGVRKWGQPEQETLPVFIRLKNRLATIPAGHQVVNRTRILATQRSWHGPSKDESKDIVRPILLNCDT